MPCLSARHFRQKVYRMSPAHQTQLETRAAARARIREQRLDNIHACRSTLAVYNEARGSIGSPPATNHTKWLSSKPQYSSCNSMVLIELVCDVEHAIAASLTKAEISSYLPVLLDFERLVTTETILDAENRLGKTFTAWAIFPVSKYLNPVRVALNRNRI